MQFTLEQILVAMTLTTLAGFSTAIGSLIAFLSKHDNLRILSFGLGFSAGVMCSVAFVEILPSVILNFKYSFYYGEFLAILLFFAGFFVSLLIDKFIPKSAHDVKEDLACLKICPLLKNDKYSLDLNGKQTLQNVRAKSLKRTGIFTALAVTLHNFPEGFATFTSSLDNLSFGVILALAVALHNIPEGMIVSLPIYYATNDKKKAFFYSALSGVAEPVGAFVGAFLILPFVNSFILNISFVVIAGFMVFISFYELMPAARTYDQANDSLYGVVSGIIIMLLSLMILKL